MKLKDCLNLTKNKANNQMSFNIKKRVLKENKVNIKDIMDLDMPLSKKLKDFEKI